MSTKSKPPTKGAFGHKTRASAVWEFRKRKAEGMKILEKMALQLKLTGQISEPTLQTLMGAIGKDKAEKATALLKETITT